MSAGEASPDAPGSPASARFRQVAERVLDALLELTPEHATELGDHRFDDRLSDLSAAGVDERVSVLREAAGSLDDLDDSALGLDERVDLEILRAAVTRDLWFAEELRPHEHDPLVHLPGDALYPLLARPLADPAGATGATGATGTAGATDRVRRRISALTARMAAVPERLAVAREMLGAMPRVHVETAIGQTRGLVPMLGADVEALADADAGLAGALRDARDVAVRALHEHAAWLESRLPVSDADPRLGPERYAAKLWYTLDAEIGPDALLTRAESDLQALEEEIAEVAAEFDGAPPRAGQVRDVLDRLAAEAPVDDASVVPLCRAALAEMTERVRALDLVTVPDDPIEIIVMPESRRGVAVAYCDPPGPLEPPGVLPTFFAVSPSPAGWPTERVASFYREYNGHMLRDLTVHEAMPGHVLQLAHAARHRGSTRVRRAFASGPFVEGWAVYAEELMATTGPGDRVRGQALGTALRLQQLKLQLRSTINAILDVRVHAHGMTEEQALRLMVERGHQEAGEAVGKWRRALLTSTQLATYYVGYREVAGVVRDLRAARPGAGDRAVHDAVLAHGSPPPRHLRTLLGL